MGRSDQIVFEFYTRVMGINLNKHFDSVGCFGQPKENTFTKMIRSRKKCFFDLSLNNWNINLFPYVSKEKFDLLICTRTAYFSKNPLEMIKEFKKLLRPGGKILIDWGLGDHWRFERFKIGWLKDQEHEFAYSEKNYLWSCYLSEKMIKSLDFSKFEKNCKKFGYDSILNAIKEEVPFVLHEKELKELGINIIVEKSMFLWPEAPQLYTCLLIEGD